MADFNEEPTEAEALQFKKDYEAKVEEAREGMGYKAKVEAPVEEETETEIETPEEEEETEVETEVDTDTEEEEPTEETEEEPQPRDKSVFRQLNEIRTQKRQAEAEKAELLEKYNKVIEENTTLKANLPPPQPFIDYAKKNGIEDPKGIKDLYDTFRTQMEEDFGTKINKLDEKIQTYEAKEVEREEQGAYDVSMQKLTGEWTEVLPIIESEYKPNATQVEQAFTLMADLAHEQKYVDKELDYILFKEASKFEEIFGGRKRRTMFSSHGRAAGDEGKREVKRDGSHESIMALMREQKAKMHAGDGFDIVDGGEI